MAADIRSELVGYLSDAVAMEENVNQMLGNMISTTDDVVMRRRMEEHRGETELQIQRLRARLGEYETSGSQLKEFAAKAAAATKSLLDMGRGEKAGRNARDVYATEHLEIAAYQLLERVATAAGDQSTAEVARTNRAEEEAMARFIDEHWDDVARKSLQEAGITAPWGSTS